MIVRLLWSACEEQPSYWRHEPTDFFWVECLPEEARAKVIPYVNTKGMGSVDQLRQLLDKAHPHLCFLVARDMRTVQPMPFYYPYSGLWGDGCPFRRIDEISIADLSELSTLRATWEGEEY